MARHRTLRQLCNDMHSMRVNAPILVDYRGSKESLCMVFLLASLAVVNHDECVCVE